MDHHNNIISFPAALAAGGEGRANPPRQANAQVIELSDRRRSQPDRAGSADLSAPNAAAQAIDVWQALNEDRVLVHYQPQYELGSGRAIAAEALVRLIGADGQLIHPDRFIGVAERSDLIVPLGRAVISQVCADLAKSRARGLAIERIAINLAARQLDADTTLVEFVDRELARHGLQYGDLEFELTERQNLALNRAGIVQLRALAERGTRIALDDFGIGYSSVMYLTELPISAFKLDRVLISRLPEDQTTRTVAKSLLALAQTLELEVVAEGVETRDQEAFLKRAGCPLAQGFGYAKPMAIDGLCTFLSGREPKSTDLDLEHG